MCEKGVQYAQNVSHAKNRTKLIRRPNLHTHKLVIDGVKIKTKLCTKCKRMARKMKWTHSWKDGLMLSFL